MRRLYRSLILLKLLALAWLPVAASNTYYVDGGCTNNGDGTGPGTCASSPGGAGAKNTIDNGIALLAASDPDAILNIRGVHGVHANCAGSDGRYEADRFQISGKSGTNGHPIIFQASGYTTLGAGTQELVYIGGGIAPNTFTQCTDCTNTSVQTFCRGVPNNAGCTAGSTPWACCSGSGAGTCGVCGDAWFTTAASPAADVIGAIKADNTPTYRTTGGVSCTAASTPWSCCSGNGAGTCASDLTNAHAGYAGTSPENDSYSAQTTGTTIVVRWGNSVPSKPYIFANNNGNGFEIRNSSFITIRGFDFRNHERAAVSANNNAFPTISDITVIDNTIQYTADHNLAGSDYGVAAYEVNNLKVQNNIFAYNGSENVHTTPKADGTATAVFVQNNWMHDMGNQNVLGPFVAGTPHGMIIANDNKVGGNYTGSIISNNLIQDGFRPNGGNGGMGILLENYASNIQVDDNVISNMPGSCIKSTTTSGAAATANSNNVIFNNLGVTCGFGSGDGTPGGILLDASCATCTTTNNQIYNNTLVACQPGIALTCTGGASCTGNIARNNIFYNSGNQKQINWTGTGTLTNNLAYSATLPGANAVATVNSTDYTCANITSLDAASKCADPVFVNSSTNFHIQSTSPAKDAGTSTGMPAARTTDINNTIASLHGFTNYADGNSIQGGVWDMGIDEFVSSGSRNPRVIASVLEGDECPPQSSCSPLSAGPVRASIVLACRAR